jgi:hypothetical protein
MVEQGKGYGPEAIVSALTVKRYTARHHPPQGSPVTSRCCPCAGDLLTPFEDRASYRRHPRGPLIE